MKDENNKTRPYLVKLKDFFQYKVALNWLLLGIFLLLSFVLAISANLILSRVNQSISQSKINLYLSEHNEHDVKRLGGQVAPLISHLGAFKTSVQAYLYEFELLVLDPQRGTTELERIAAEIVVHMEATTTLARTILPNELIEDLRELSYVAEDISIEAASTVSPNMLSQLYWDSKDMNEEFRSKFNGAYAILNDSVGAITDDVQEDTVVLRSNAVKQEYQLQQLGYISKWALGGLALLLAGAGVLMLRILYTRLESVASYAERIAQGDYTRNAVELPQDRLGDMGRAVNHMGETLSRMVAQSKAKELRLADAQRIAKLGEWEWDTVRNEWHWSEAACRIIGVSQFLQNSDREAYLSLVHSDERLQVIGAFKDLLRLGQNINLEYRLCRKNGEEVVIQEQGEAVRDDAGNIIKVFGTLQDVTERKDIERKIRHLAYYDVLTDLPNRQLFLDRLSWAIEFAKRHQTMPVLMFLDLDRFKHVNDTYGHNVGDELLKDVAVRLKQSLRITDQVALGVSGFANVELSRLGGDEFTVLLTDIERREDVVQVAQRIIESLEEPFSCEGHEFVVTPSIGIAVYPEDGRDVESLVKNADLAMYHAKEKGRNGFEFYQQSMGEASRYRVMVENNLRQAFDSKEITLFYQPKVDVKSKLIVGAEVLVRWHHPQWGEVMPDEFIPVAEDTGLIVQLGEKVLAEACQQLDHWRRRGFKLMPLSINVSSQQFLVGDLAGVIATYLQNYGLSASMLNLEITEGTIMEESGRVMTVIQSLKKMGLVLSLDDFGTGYSSLSYLKRFPIDEIKIDQAFVRDIETDQDDAEIIKAILAMARSINLKVVAEGVETAAQYEFLKALECDVVQGYYFGAAVPADEFEKKLVLGEVCTESRKSL